MGWKDDLVNGIKEAFRRKTSCRIAVHTQAQVELGQKAAQRLASQYGAYAGDVQFELIPKDQQEIYLVGIVLK